MDELKTIIALLARAKRPEDVFGLPGNIPDVKEWIQRQYRILAKKLHPDKYPDQSEKRLAEDAFKILSRLWSEAQIDIKNNEYGKRGLYHTMIAFQSRRYAYTITQRLHTGGTAGIFEGTAQGKTGDLFPVVIKIPHTPEDNDLLEREARALTLMQKKVKETKAEDQVITWFLHHVPNLLESVKIQEPGSVPKVANVFRKHSKLEGGWFTLEQIRAQHPEGVSTRVMTFIWNRVLEGLTLAHAAGVMHCHLTPNHIFIHADTHAGNIIDWTASCVIGTGERVPYLDGAYRAYFPDEVLDKNGGPSPASDIFMSAWCMVYILGGDPEEKNIPDTVEEPIRGLLNRCLQPKKNLRPKTAPIVYQEFEQITYDLFGRKKFVSLDMMTQNTKS